MKLKGKRILLTGGTAGIGLELVQQLAVDNTLLVLGRDPTKLAALERRFPTLSTAWCDLSDPVAVAAWATAVQATQPAWDVLIMNAAVQVEPWVTDPAFSAASIPIEIATNFTAVVQITAVLGPKMRGTAAAPAVIALVNSGLGLVPKASSAVYCATKAALRSYGISLGHQLASRHVQVVQTFLPLVDTAMTAGRGAGKISAGEAARGIIAGIEIGNTEHMVGQVRLLCVIQRFAPRLARRLMLKR